MGKYDDIINIKYTGSINPKRPKLSMEQRAAQFAPFAALTGYEEAIQDIERVLDNKILLSMEDRLELSRKLNYILSLNSKPVVEITFFKKDNFKDGGEYKTIKGVVKKYDKSIRCVIMEKGTKILANNILTINSEVFDDFF